MFLREEGKKEVGRSGRAWVVFSHLGDCRDQVELTPRPGGELGDGSIVEENRSKAGLAAEREA